MNLNPFRKPEIRYFHKDGYPPYPYVANDLTFFNLAFRNKEVALMQHQCNEEIKAAKDKMLTAKLRKVVREEIAA